MKIFKILVLIVIVIILAEGIPLVKKKLWKELVTFGILIFISIVLMVGKRLDIQPPLGLLGNLLSPIGKMLFMKK